MRDGQTLAPAPDLTIPTARRRHQAVHGTAPLRLFYIGNVFRTTKNRRPTPAREFSQDRLANDRRQQCAPMSKSSA
ncbi:MAG: ATP phosphoribosyltransferase regulatory subunit [Anaerolineae bacterium]|nr:ATP phosphoribosyltransferase regulatory subunit [Anaerolineae bacterium]